MGCNGKTKKDWADHMIPKVIHYCWFGKDTLPDEAQKCIQSWRKYCPDYEIKRWNEANFDINCCKYVREAYEAKKWAFVSDYARFWILYNYGGIYFDTDVEIIRPIDDIISHGAFMGIEAGPDVVVAPGLGIGVEEKNSICGEILEYYNRQSFRLADGTINKTTVVVRISEIMKNNGYRASGEKEMVGGITIYPAEYFCPMNYYNGKTVITDNTRTIHHYAETWHNPAERLIETIRRKLYDTRYCDSVLQKIMIFPFRVWNKLIYIYEKK